MWPRLHPLTHATCKTTLKFTESISLQRIDQFADEEALPTSGVRGQTVQEVKKKNTGVLNTEPSTGKLYPNK